VLAKLNAAGVDAAAFPDVGKLQALMTALQTHFVDKDFPPNGVSVARSGDTAQFGKFVTWRRAGELMTQPRLVADGIDPQDIKQGILGNCWFCCALSSLAENPHLVERVFVTKDASPTGVHRLRLCHEGRWHDVTLDDFFPAAPGHGPLFSRNHGEELWVMLVEKAYAKLHGSYEDLISGRAVDAMADLTGYPTEYVSFSDEDAQRRIESGEMWAFIERVVGRENQVAAAGTFGHDEYTARGVDPETEAGIVPGHAYTVLHAQEALGQKLLKIRNPWGRFEWRGDWSDGSPLWTPEAKEAFKPTFDKEDGVFWMSFADFLRYFDSLHVCFWHSSSGQPWHEDRVEVNFIRELEAVSQGGRSSVDEKDVVEVSDDPNVIDLRKSRQAAAHNFRLLADKFFVVRVTTQSELCFSLYQHEEVDVGVLVVSNAEGKVVCDTRMDLQKREHARCVLAPGDYTVMPFTAAARLAGRDSYRCVLAVHATDPNAAHLSPRRTDPVLLWQMVEALVHERGKAKDTAPGVRTVSYWSGMCIFYAVETTDKLPHKVSMTMDCSKSKNALSLRAPLMTSSYDMFPRNFRLFHVLVPADLEQPFTYSFALTWK
jgi:hypothetical protein